LLVGATAVLAGVSQDSVRAVPSTGARFEAAGQQRIWDCPPDATYSQPGEGCNDPEWSGYTSAVGLDFSYLCQDNFNVNSDICDIHFWGLALRWNDGWSAGDPAALLFDITFYADAGGVPGAAMCSYVGLTASYTYLETCFGVYDVYYFSIPSLSPCCSWSGAGWVSIQSQAAPPNYDVFLWVTSEFGDNVAYQNGGNLGVDLGFCLTGVYIPAWGACCFDATGDCYDNIERLECLGAGGRFAADTLCANLQPPCGQAPGACCYDNGYCTYVPQSMCGLLLGDMDCDGDVDFDDINPFVEVLSGGSGCNPGAGDCDQDGDVDFDDINMLVCFIQQACAPIHGTWLGVGSNCDDCPCIVPCPPGATPEGEPCYTDTNGGCNSVPYLWGWITCGETICGTSYFDGGTRDTDWFRIDTAVSNYFTITGEAEFDLQLLFLQDAGADCVGYSYWYVWVAPCDTATIMTDCFPPSTYYVWVGPQFTVPFDCTEGTQYWVHLDCVECYIPLGACCKCGVCTPNMSAADCGAIGGTWLGEGTTCDGNPCGEPPLGDNCDNPFIVGALPFDGYGNTCSYCDNYDEVCPYSGSTSPDVVYYFAPADNMVITATLCVSPTDYDTKLYIYEGGCPGNLIACNDDMCQTPEYPIDWISRVEDVPLSGGGAYYFVVDGYGGSCGNYHLNIAQAVPCDVVCPPGGVPEAEPCGSDTNGGCNMPNPTFEPIYCNETICGTAWFDGGTRDTDWYELVLTEPMMVTVTGIAEFKAVFGWIEQYTPGVPGCANITGYFLQYAVVDKCVEGTFTTECWAPGTYYVWAGPQFVNPIYCGTFDEYVLTITCQPCTPPVGACCLNGVCLGDMTAPECGNQGGTWFQGESCSYFQCPVPPANDTCANAEAISEPYPVTVYGSCIGSTIDCPGLLDWNAVWYKVYLPNTNNRLAVTYCGATVGIGTVGIVYYDMCDDCPNYHIVTSYSWNSCSPGGDYGIDMWWDNVSGPRDVYVPAYLVDAYYLPMDFYATFNVTAMAPGPVTSKNPPATNSTASQMQLAKPAPKIAR
jgi:hypothetical protein